MPICRKLLTALASAVVCISAYAVDDEPAMAAPAAQSRLLATVNGAPITSQTLELYGRMRTGGAPHAISDGQNKELINEIINRELVYQDAMNNGLDKSPDVQAQIAEQIRNVLTTYRIQQMLDRSPPSEEQLNKVYQEQVVARSSTEYKARHVLTETEDAAKEVIKELKQGKDFIELANSASTGPSAKDGGDLGWFAPNQVVKPFADAVMALKPGKYSKVPVHTQFGWHVILLEDMRKVEPPPFERVREQLETVVQNELIGQYIDGLKQKAEVVIKDE